MPKGGRKTINFFSHFHGLMPDNNYKHLECIVMQGTHSKPRRDQMSHICDISALRVKPPPPPLPPPSFWQPLKNHRKMVFNKVYCIKNIQTVFFYYHYGIQNPEPKISKLSWGGGGGGSCSQTPLQFTGMLCTTQIFQSPPPPLTPLVYARVHNYI